MADVRAAMHDLLSNTFNLVKFASIINRHKQLITGPSVALRKRPKPTEWASDGPVRAL